MATPQLPNPPLHHLRFTRYELKSGVSFSTQTGTAGPWTGIYVLEFRDGQEYVGQTVNLPSRLAAHRRRWPDLVAARFAPVPQDDLDQFEQAMINERQEQGLGLRNQIGVIASAEPIKLDLAEDDADLPEWLTAEFGVPRIGERWQEPKGPLMATAAQAEAARKLSQRADYGDIVLLLALYVAKVINTRPDLTECKEWYVSALPSTNRARNHHRLSAISVNNAEVLVICEGRDDQTRPWETFWFMNTAPVDMPRWAADETYAGYYHTTGVVTRVFGNRAIDLAALLTDRKVLDAARLLAHGLLRKGPGLYARYHSFCLADDVFQAVREIAVGWPAGHLVDDEWLAGKGLGRAQLADQPRPRGRRLRPNLSVPLVRSNTNRAA